MRILLSLLLILLCLPPLNSQSDWCGTDLSRLSAEEQAAALAFSRRTILPAARSNDTDSVAVTIHIVESQSQGATDFTLTEVEAEMAKVNRIFGSAGIYFFICGSPRYIEGDAAYNFTTGNELNQQSYVPNTINIYFVDDLVNSSSQGLCGYAQFPFKDTEENRYIMMNKLCATDGATLIHEFGHFYGLFHTHETQFGRELVDRSNCANAGDLLCDTSADPNLGYSDYMSGCTYIGSATDYQGSTYVPPITNFMSYAPAACQRFFSKEQQLLIQDVQQNENAYLINNCDFYPDFSILRDQSRFKIRSDEKITANYNLRISNVDQGYNVKLKISLAEDPDKIGLLLHEERLILPAGQNSFSLDFELDVPIFQGTGTYYLKAFIDADNDVIERTEKNNLALTTVEIDNSQLGEAVLFPNPAQDQLKLFIRDPDALKNYKVRILRYDGRLIWEDRGYKIQEEFFQLIDLSHLSLGFYLITVDFYDAEKSYTFKFFKQ